MNNWKWIVPVFLLCIVVAVTVPLVVINRDATSDEEGEGPLVNTNVGPIRGIAASQGDYSMFLGIPYAVVNSSNPFGQSIPHEGFEDTFNAFDDSAVCVQRTAFSSENNVIGNLDCLRLNIHVPNKASSENRLAVMVWIHGGGFRTGSASKQVYNPKFLVAHDVIVVTLNYRLGIYGFLCLDIPEIPGNQGLRDQLTALRWIKSNIEAFGGDTNRITVFGESAGGTSTNLHYIFSQEDLFNNIILQSGTAFSDYAFNASNPSAVLQIAGHLGHATDNLFDALKFLETVDTNLVVEATTAIGFNTGPCVEQEFVNVERYITTRPAYADVPNAKTKPVMIGFNDNEVGVNFMDPRPDREAFQIIGDYYYYLDEDYLAKVVDIVRKFYIGDDDYDEVEEKQRVGYFRSDFRYLHSTYRTIDKCLANGASSIYHYMFSYKGNRNLFSTLLNSNVDGALHADELAYLFDMEVFPETPTPEDQLIISRMTTMWTNFAKYSNPIPETSDILPFQWPVATAESMHCLNLDSELRLQRRAFHDRMAFWDLFHMMFL